MTDAPLDERVSKLEAASSALTAEVEGLKLRSDVLDRANELLISFLATFHRDDLQAIAKAWRRRWQAEAPRPGGGQDDQRWIELGRVLERLENGLLLSPDELLTEVFDQ